jgi:hypothetical protein
MQCFLDIVKGFVMTISAITKTTALRCTLMAVAGLSLGACIADPRLNTGISIGQDGVSMEPSVQAQVGGGLLQYTPQLR